MKRDPLTTRYAGIGLILLFSIACNAIFAPPTPTAVPPTNTPLPTATATATATPVPTPTPTPIPDYNGVWKGTSVQDYAVILTVENNTVVSFKMEVDLVKSDCRINFWGTLKLNAPIEEGAFDDTIDVYQGEFSINGRFDSEETASGTFIYTQTAGCAGKVAVEWSAVKSDTD
ncbi:MAG: hypothetical protein JW730_19095 [Anaerolineales bacterium]|nr:hypothetical protein [Anaerolineales bacterium]